jgi:hypothetical protein
VVQELTFIINTVKISLSGTLSLDNIEENDKVKVKVTLQQATKTQRGAEV